MKNLSSLFATAVPKRPLVLQGKPDCLFQIKDYPKEFSFNGQVADVFDDMICRSVPLYDSVLRTVLSWAEEILQENEIFYDVGCSTGTLIKLLFDEINDKSIEFFGVDPSRQMLSLAKKKCQHHSVRWLCKKAEDVDYSGAAMIVSNYTLQFVEKKQRLRLIKKFYQGLRRGGVLFFSEKIVPSSALARQIMCKEYDEFKRGKGYSYSEIERKKEALVNALIPATLKDYEKYLAVAGFRSYEVVLRWQQFVSIVAEKV